jgi:hypothetical protein
MRVHFAHFTTLRRVAWTLCPYSVHFVHFTNENRELWTLCTLPCTPSMPPLTFAGAMRPAS